MIEYLFFFFSKRSMYILRMYAGERKRRDGMDRWWKSGSGGHRVVGRGGFAGARVENLFLITAI